MQNQYVIICYALAISMGKIFLFSVLSPLISRKICRFRYPPHQFYIDFIHISHHHMVRPAIWIGLRRYVDSWRIYPITQSERNCHPDFWPILCLAAGIKGHKSESSFVSKGNLGFCDLNFYFRNLCQNLIFQSFVKGKSIHMLPKEEKNITVHGYSTVSFLGRKKSTANVRKSVISGM